jgi:drug/metabolite transporter (DMT)-like permease
MMCAGVACLSVNDAIGKSLTANYSPVEILFLRNLIALPIALLIAWRMGGTAALRSYRPAAHLARGVIWLCAATLFFTGLRYLGLAEATALVFAAPVFVTALSALVLAEHVGWRRWLAVLVGFLGVLVVVRPGSSTFHAASLFPVATAFVYATLMISARWVDPRESVWTLMLYLVGAGALLSGLLSPFVWTAVRVEDLGLFFGIALFGTVGMTLITQAFRFAPAAVVAPFDYSALLWATVLGWLIWGEIPDLVTYIGAGIIIISGLLIVLRERQMGS